jgi:CheY-like chemotaxis protein
MEKFKYKKALLIDDSYIDNLINRKILENNDFAESIVVMDSPEKAFDYVNECLSLGKDHLPEIIFLDLRMQEMSGFEFLSIFDTIEGLEPQQIRIYVLSSSLDPSDLKKIRENSLVSRFISKPLTNQSLAEI